MALWILARDMAISKVMEVWIRHIYRNLLVVRNNDSIPHHDVNRPWQSQPTKKGKGAVTKIDFTIGVLFYGPKEAPNTIR